MQSLSAKKLTWQVVKPVSPIIHNANLLTLICFLSLVSTSILQAQEAKWIWSPEFPRGQATAGDCYFRKVIQLTSIEQASVTITADDRYDLYVNGRMIGQGRSVRQMEQYEITRFLTRGRNVIGVRVSNLTDGHAALAARVFVKPSNAPWRSYSSDESWRTALDQLPNWTVATFNDANWKGATAFGLLGETTPWDIAEKADPSQLSENARFQIPNEFAVEEILDNEATGSLINIAFNEFGHIIASREDGKLLLIYDSDKDGVPDKTREYCDLVQGIQGILPLNGDVYVTGHGPDGPGLYRLLDNDRNGSLEDSRKIIGFRGEFGEHGAHGLTLGPDGQIYCVLGNHVQLDGDYADSSPLRNYYEGDLLQPRYEDPGGHANGIKAPGGSIIRLDLDGNRVEVVAGGLRNAYDLAFNSAGGLFVHDSDMESDEGSAWYRPTTLYRVTEGAEYGWRSGWAKWPTYYLDRLPPLLETGRGSPTGACFYDHFAFPQRYHGCLFLADWTAGQIVSVRLQDGPNGGTAQSDVFIKGQPLNVTDLAIGPDGCLYFCTGGRGTRGGIYRVRWRGKVPESVSNLGDGIAKAIKQPQLDSAWSRQSIAALKRELGASWSDLVAGVAFSDDNSAKYRLRALELMQLFGPVPSPTLLAALCSAKSEEVRMRAAYLLGQHADSNEAARQLKKLIVDEDPMVQRSACEAMLRCGVLPDVDTLIPLISSNDRFLAWTARRLLERIPTAQWRERLLSHTDQRVQIQAALALAIAEPTRETGTAIVSMCRTMLQGFVSDRNFVDLLRVVQVALHRTGLTAADVPGLASDLSAEFPIGEPVLNQELFKILAHLNCDSVIPSAISYIQSDVDIAFRMHVAMQLRYFHHAWTSAERHAIVKFFEETQPIDSGSSVPLYVMNVTRDLCRDLPLEDARIFVSEGAKWPNAALVSLYQYPDQLSSNDLQTLRKLDEEIDGPGFEGEQYKRLRTGIVAMLSQSGDAPSQAYLREVWVRSPERRQAIALGLSMYPSDENWDYLVRSLPVLETYAVTEVLGALQKIPAATDDPNALREVILHGLRMEADNQTPAAAIALLRYWTGTDLQSTENADSQMTGWQEWFAQKFPDSPEAKLPELEENSPWNVETLAEYFASSDGRKGNLEHGKLAYEKAQCAKCHRMGTQGSTVGPDLTTVAKRFTRNEVLESILYPSHVISNQYRSYRVLTIDNKVYTGIIAARSKGSITLRDAELIDHIIAEQDIDLLEPSKISIMPTGLMDELTSAEIRDLMTFLGYVPNQQVADSTGSTGDVVR